MLKKILITTFILLSTLTSSYATEENSVWLPYAGGNLDAICRTIWNEYDQTYKSSTKIVVKQGANGTAGVIDMLSAPDYRKFICIPSSVMYNQIAYPDIDSSAINDLTVLIQIVRIPVVWYVPNSIKATNLKELIAHFNSINRTVNVGVFTATHVAIARQIASTYNLNINIVNFKNGTQMYPSLFDGTLDLALDSGGAVQVAESGKFKVLGYAAIDNYDKLSAYPNFSKDEPTLNQSGSWFSIATSKNVSPAIREEVTRNLKNIIKQEKFQKFVKDSLGTASGITQPELGQILNSGQATFKRYWK